MSPSTDPAGRVALITGASRGIGRATALALAEDGIDVIATYLSSPDAARTLVSQIEGRGASAMALRLDVGDIASHDEFAQSVRSALNDRWGRSSFDYLINNGGSQRPGSFAEATEKDFDELVGVMFKGVFFLTQKLVPLIADGGSIINISSGMTRFYVPQRVIYSATKAALETLTHHLAQELGPQNITVNTIAPGATATEFSGGLLRDNDQVQAMVSSQTALRRYGLAEDVSGAIAALLEDRNHWVNGQRIEVSGGVHL
jgi:NAD(P)-dependent dehydrogenase (short-subunit alcohol dehydrogenase family)